MATPFLYSEGDRDDAVAFLAQLIRLQSEVHELGHELDRIEEEIRQAVNDLARERFEDP